MVWPTDGRWRMRHEVHYGDRLVRCFAERPPNLNTLFRRTVADFPEHDALVDGARRISYAALDHAVEHVAGNLAGLGVGKGDRVAILLDNRAEFVYANLACARLGAVAVPMNIRQRRPEIEYALNHCGASALLFEAELAAELPPAESVPALVHRIVVGEGDAGTTPFTALLEPAAAPDVDLAEDDVCTILYTSGTTGRPKGAMLTHFSQIQSLSHFEMGMKLQHGSERTILCVPGSHVTGLTAVLLTMIAVGGCTVLNRAFKADAFVALAAGERITVSIMVPAMYNLCLLQPRFRDHDLSAWRVGGYGGAPMPTATIAALAEELPNLQLMNAYGATEATSPATLMPLGQTAGREDSVGRVLPCADIRVMDDDGREVATGATGEIWIGGATVVPGYWNNAAANAETFVGGYWKSGDIGSIDADGYVRVFDRKKDMINRAGFKVYSAEVENVLSHHPEIVEAAVVARPDPVLGEKVQAFIVADGDARDPEHVRAFCAERMSDYKVPDFITYLADGLPRNANGKILKPVLRDMVEAEIGSETEAAE